MNKRILQQKTLLTLLAIGVVLATQAQVFMPPFENAANLSMGSALVALPEPLNGVSNPAQLGRAPRMGVQLWSAVPYSLTGWQSHGFQYNQRIQGRSGVGIEVLHSGVEGYAEQRVQLRYGRRLSEKFSIGGAVQGMRVSANEYGQANILTFEVGILAQALPKLTVGASIQNPIPQRLAGATVGSLFRVGGAWRPSKTLLLTTELQKDLERPTQVRAGLEYRPVEILRLRAGIRTLPARSSFGLGLALKNGLQLDFGSEWHPVLGFTPGAMLRWTKP